MNPLNRLILGLGLLAVSLNGSGKPGAVTVASEDGNFTLSGQLIGGGGSATRDSTTLVGRITAAAAGSSSGGEYRLVGGVVGPIVVPTPGAPTIRITLAGDQQALLSWPEGTVGFVLEYSDAIGTAAVWAPVDPQPAGNSFAAALAQPARFYRLHRP